MARTNRSKRTTKAPSQKSKQTPVTKKSTGSLTERLAKRLKSPNAGKPITRVDEKLIVEVLNDFASWLVHEVKLVKDLSHIKYAVDMPFASEDWIMKVDDAKKTVSFNTNLSAKCSFGYYLSILIHEFFHLAIQKVPNKEDAVRVKDDFGDELMKLIDIEADFFTALYFKANLDYGLVDYLSLYYEGSTVFSDKWIRANKLERFIGTLLSISKMFMHDDKKIKSTSFCDLYLPSISPIYTEDSLHILVIKKEHIYFDEIKATYNDFKELKTCYTNVDTLTPKGYIEKLVNFVCGAFNMNIPENVTADLNNLN